MKKQAPLVQAKHLGDVLLNPYRFEGLESAIGELCSKEFKKLNEKQKGERINRLLLEFIEAAPEESFLLIALLEFIDRINREKCLESYNFSNFELWLNQFSELSDEDNYRIRAKIIGKRIMRDDYQALFPVGMGRIYPGSHFVTAHSSPDLDTTVASFWGWVDAFGARVAENLHIWNIPGGAPPSSVEVALLFHQIFGANVFTYLAKTRTTLAISSLDLMTQKGMVKQRTDQSSLQVDHERAEKAVVLVDEAGYFLGDWRNFDVEGVRQVTMLLNNCLRWFENNLHVKLISLFARESLSLEDLPPFVSSIGDMRIADCQPAKEFTSKQKQYLEVFLKRVLKAEKGLNTTFKEFAEAMKSLELFDFQECMDMLYALAHSKLFDVSGLLVESRPRIFHLLEKIIMVLDRAIQNTRAFTERLEVALSIKTQVFGYFPHVISYRADLDEIRSKMGNYPYLTVTSSDEKGKLIPLGVVRSSEVHKPILGTVTVRDFCNREETKIPSYLEIISVIDHHKSTFTTSSAPVVYISDVQSSNTTVAELAFRINDPYSTRGMSLESIEKQLRALQKKEETSETRRLIGRLLKLYEVAKNQKENPFFIHPLREFIEYKQFLYAILDDTDLLSKATKRDVEIVAELLNRLKSLMLQEEVEIISFEKLPQDRTFVEKAAALILQNPDMYSLYRKVYLAKERLVEENLELCAEGKESSIFVDTKLQNGCCMVGQTKMFANNFAAFEKHAPHIRALWAQRAYDFYKDRKEVDLHLHMISTIPGAEDLYSGTGKEYTHKDELWIWIPSSEQGIEHLKSFLSAFRLCPQLANNSLEVLFTGENAKELSQVFKESFLPIPHHLPSSKKEEGLPIAILRFRAGSINSRKAMISPYLPNLIS